MSERTEPNLKEEINSAGDGSGLQLPPAFVMVSPRQHRKYKKNNETVDGRSKGAKDLFSRIQKRKMKEETNVTKLYLQIPRELKSRSNKVRNWVVKRISRKNVEKLKKK